MMSDADPCDALFGFLSLPPGTETSRREDISKTDLLLLRSECFSPDAHHGSSFS